jgi:GDP-mannose 6-dehydrogenase
MKISVFGLGYVGSVATACFARDGHQVIGVDIDPYKADLVNRGISPIVEKDLPDMLSEGVQTGAIRATTDQREAVLNTDLSLICVGTPSKPRGDLDLSRVIQVCETIGHTLKNRPPHHLIVVRSTMIPGSMEDYVIPTLEQSSGKSAGDGFGVAINPEFLRESSAIHDFYHPPKTVIGALDETAAQKVASLYEKLDAPLFLTSIKTAEMIKYTDNIFHALKVVFGNEIGLICKQMGVDSDEVMEIFCQDQKLNLSPAYLKPGFAFGGSCLPKDLRAIARLARARDIEVPLLDAIGFSNDSLVRRAAELVLSKSRRRIGVMGFAFKGGTDDLRESPVLTLIEILLGKGCNLKIYDRHVSLSHLIGANRRYVEEHLPHIAALMVESLEELVSHADLIVIGNHDEQFVEAVQKLEPNQLVIDLIGALPSNQSHELYERLTG